METAGTERMTETPQEMTPGDLAELMDSFGEVTSRLERTHTRLRAEVSRLSAELRDANEKLQRSKRLAALGEMAAGISHEIRNPLASLRLYSGALVEDLAGQDGPRELAEKVAGVVSHLDAIVGDVLDFSREYRLSVGVTDWEELSAGAAGACRARGLRITTDGRGELVCDQQLARQAVVNLIRNASDAMSGRGVVRLSMRTELKFADDGDRRAWDVVSVTDQGPGIPEEVVERMFNPFFTTRETGTGLGLAIVHRILDAHGGRVEVGDQSPGARVELWFPRAIERRDTSGTRGAA